MYFCCAGKPKTRVIMHVFFRFLSSCAARGICQAGTVASTIYIPVWRFVELEGSLPRCVFQSHTTG